MQLIVNKPRQCQLALGMKMISELITRRIIRGGGKVNVNIRRKENVAFSECSKGNKIRDVAKHRPKKLNLF